MSLSCVITTLVFSISLFFLPGGARSAEINAFILHSYHQEYPWTKLENSGIVETLQNLSSQGDINFSTEYLDTKRVSYSINYTEFFVNYLRTKYSDFKPDIIFITDDNALRFMTDYRSRIFPNIPVVFCGVNDASYLEKSPSEDTYGIFEIKDISSNLQLINTLFPNIEKVTFIGDNSETYHTIHLQILSDAALNFPKYDLNFIAHRDLDQVENLIKATTNSVLVLTTIGGFHDSNDNVLSIKTIIQRLRSLGDYAIISMEDVYMQDGVLGGIVTSGKAQGRNAAELGYQLLSGESFNKTERFVNGPNIPIFDHHELVRLGLPTSRLPLDSVIVNQPLSIYQAFRGIFISVILSFAVLCVLIFFLLLSIGRRKKAEQELNASSNFLNSVLDNLPDIVFVKDAKNLNFVRLNRAGEAIFGETAEQVIGKNDYDFFSKNEADFLAEKDRDVLTSRKLHDIPFEQIHTSIGIRQFHTKKIPILDERGNPAFLLGISRDITEQMLANREKNELENRLKQSQKMESIGTLAGGIAHDFNNILSAIIGYTELAQQQPDISKGVKDLLDGTLKGAERAKELVSQILTFSRKSEQQKIPVILADIVEESLILLKSFLPSTIEIKNEIFSNNMILADPTQMHQVIMNLCTNGYHAMQNTGGILLVTLQEIDVDTSPKERVPDMVKGRYLHLAVTDLGKGMDREVLDRIFDPYFTTKGPDTGTGLGLAVVHGIVESHEGIIVVNSEIDRGTTVSVYFPVIESTEVDSEEEDSQSIDHAGVGNGELLLLVDDEPDIINLTESFLKKFGYRVHSFSDSQKALAHYKKEGGHYSAVITDMTMPNLTGVELAYEILELNSDAKIILCTGYSETINRTKALTMGISEYLEKPVSIKELLATVEGVLSK